jgi:hypothetical protein
MPDGTVRIRVGASLDRSVEVVFSQIEKRGQRAAKTIETQMSRGVGRSGSGSPYRTAAQEFERSQQAIARAADRSARDRERYERRAVKAAVGGWVEIGKVAEREMRRISRERQREVDRFATRTSHRATRFAFGAPEGMARFGRRVGQDFLRGAGVDFNIGGAVQRGIGLQTSAIGLAQQERIASGSSRGAGAFAAEARTQAQALGTTPEKIIEMQRAFTGKTGDFGAMSSITPRLGKMALAAGADLGEMGDAAGYVFNQLKDLPDAGERTIAVMRNIVGQTAVGAVEMKDFATQMGRIAANAGHFAGDKGSNISKLGALAQLSIATGGASSAADAARSVGAFATTFKTKARIGAFEKQGIDVFTDKSRNTIKDPFALIKESLVQTKGDIPKMSTLFASVLGNKPVTALAQVFKGAGGGQAGLKAVDAELDKYMRAQLDATTEAKNFADHMASDAVKAQQFQNALDQIVMTTANKVLPAFERLAPDVLKLAEASGEVASFLANNLGGTVALAITASIAKAGVESAFRSGVESMIKGALGSAPGQMPGAAGIGAVSNAGAYLAIAAVGVATFTVTKMVVEHMLNEEAEAQGKAAVENAQGGATLVNAEIAAKSGQIDPQLLEQVKKERINLAKRVAGATVLKNNGGPGELERLSALAGGREKEYAAASTDIGHIDELKDEQRRMTKLLEMVRSGVLKVSIVDGPPGVDPRGRQPPPGVPPMLARP